MAIFVAKSGQLQTVKGVYQNIRIEPEVHVQFGNSRIPYTAISSKVAYTRDVDRRFNSNNTPLDKSLTGQNFPVWFWTEPNTDDNYNTLYIGCKYFYPEFGGKLYVHNTSPYNANNGLFRHLKTKDLEFTRCWDTSYITSLTCGFKDTSITDFSAIEDWNLENVTSVNEVFSQLGNRNIAPFLKCRLGKGNQVDISTFCYYNHYNITTWDAMCSRWNIKLTNNFGNESDASLNATFLPNMRYLDLTNWDLTEWNMNRILFFTSDYYGTRIYKIKTPILPLTVKPMKLPYTMYDMDTEQAYTEIPLNLDRQLTLYKNKSDFGK